MQSSFPNLVGKTPTPGKTHVVDYVIHGFASVLQLAMKVDGINNKCYQWDLKLFSLVMQKTAFRMTLDIKATLIN
jgi:hypothetical protein